MNRRLLAISWDMPPLSGPRAVQVSRTLKQLGSLGWESAVVCFDARSNRYNQDHELASKLRAPQVTLVPVRSLEERLPFRLLWRAAPPLKLLPDEKSVWIGAAARAAQRLASERTYDVLVSFAQPWSDHLAGLRVHRATGLPWVAHFSDPWVDSPYIRGRLWQRRIWARMEAAVVGEADALVFVNAHAAERVMRKYPDEYRAKTHVVPHGYDPSERAAIRPAARDNRLTLVHTGRFYDGLRTPEALLRALAALNRRRPIEGEVRVVFVGAPIDSHRRLARTLGLSASVDFIGRVSAAESAGWAEAADVLLVIDAPAEESLFLPSKLVDYLPYRKTILGLTPPCGASADLLRAVGCLVVAPDDEEAIASAVDALLTAAREGRLAPAQWHDEAAGAYHIARTTDAFARILERCA